MDHIAQELRKVASELKTAGRDIYGLAFGDGSKIAAYFSNDRNALQYIADMYSVDVEGLNIETKPRLDGTGFTYKPDGTRKKLSASIKDHTGPKVVIWQSFT